MPRPKLHSRAELVEKAMYYFWNHGYGATSMDDLVKATRSSRHSFYGNFDGKQKLFNDCLDTYSNLIVSPAFAQVEKADAKLSEIASYFEFQIARAEKSDNPPPGCLMANTMTELAHHDDKVAIAKVAQHNLRLHRGFLNALGNSVHGEGRRFPPNTLNELAWVMVTFTNGLWSMSRTMSDFQMLRGILSQFLVLIQRSVKS